RGDNPQDITEKDGTKVKNNQSTLHYLLNGIQQRKKHKIVYNKLVTPKGGEYRVVLSDGTKVWLNAVSSLKFHTQFKGDSRKVELTGEAYFEVAENKKKPFLVRTENMRVAVLGTSFNISAYEDDGRQSITLVEGAVKVSDKSEAGLIL